MMLKPVRYTIDIFLNSVETRIQIAEVAKRVCISTRQLERSFKQATGISPLKYYRMIRMKHAHQLILYSGETITEIALSIGYATQLVMVTHLWHNPAKRP